MFVSRGSFDMDINSFVLSDSLSCCVGRTCRHLIDPFNGSEFLLWPCNSVN